jgi:hypothetical protein
MEQKTLRLTLLAAAFALSGTAWAQANSTASYIERTSPRFESFAGSRDNYSSLATGLRTGGAITLTGSGETVSFNSPTKPMGYGNITRSMDLAQRQLAAQGITNPTPTQLQAAMTGGTIKNADGTVKTYDGVLKLRADGMGWGQIARKVDVHPGMGKSTSASASSSGRITTAAGGSVAAGGKAVGKPASAGSQGRQSTQISSAAGGNAFGHGSGRGVGASGGMSNAGGAGHGHGNAGGGGGGRGK